MSFVIYDIETTGLDNRFDQILQFAAVRTDADLTVTDRLDLRIRLMPHIVPSPTALHVNRADIADLMRPELPSHYEAVCAIADRLRSWSPSVFLGYNSIRFDEEFLRQAFYLCLQPMFLTNTNGNARADVLNVMRAAAALSPGALTIPVEEGRPSFRLAPLARANGYQGGPAHNATNDVDATLYLCRLIADRAPEIWSRVLQFAQRRVVSEFVASEEAFVYFDQVGPLHSTHIVTSLGASPTRSALHFCADLKADLDGLARMDRADLVEVLAAQPRPIRRLRLNGAPFLTPLYEATPELLDGRSEEDFLNRARALKGDLPLVAKLMEAAQAAERTFPDSPHLEKQIYSGGFPSNEEAAKLRRFHEVEWALRRDVVNSFADPRHRSVAIRLFYSERPDLLSDTHNAGIAAEISRRRRGVSSQQPECMTIPAALAEIGALREGPLDDLATRRLQNLEAYLTALA